MGLPALQQIEHLSAAVEARSDEAVRAGDVVRAGEVVSFSLGNLMRSVADVIADIDGLRSTMIQARLALNELTHDAARGESIERLARFRVALRRFTKLISRPMLARPKGHSLVRLAEMLEQATPARIADARMMRKLARRVREHAERCDLQRERLHARTCIALEIVDQIAAEGDRSPEHEKALMTALIAGARDRHPIINAYLAR